MRRSAAAAWLTGEETVRCSSLLLSRRLKLDSLPVALGRGPGGSINKHSGPRCPRIKPAGSNAISTRRTFATTMAEAQDRVVSLRNRCDESKSPYVRSHMENPTAWQLWEPETLALAKRTGRLMFVSIGYSACHWYVSSRKPPSTIPGR